MQLGALKSDVAEKEGLCVDDNFCGHGIGRFLHCKPLIQHCRNADKTIIEEGMVFTVEPILTLFPHKQLYVWSDGFTVTSKNNPSAQMEHMIVVHENGPEILTTV